MRGANCKWPLSSLHDARIDHLAPARHHAIEAAVLGFLVLGVGQPDHVKPGKPLARTSTLTSCAPKLTKSRLLSTDRPIPGHGTAPFTRTVLSIPNIFKM